MAVTVKVNFGFGPEAVVLSVKERDYVLLKIAPSTISLVGKKKG